MLYLQQVLLPIHLSDHTLHGPAAREWYSLVGRATPSSRKTPFSPMRNSSIGSSGSTQEA